MVDAVDLHDVVVDEVGRFDAALVEQLARCARALVLRCCITQHGESHDVNVRGRALAETLHVFGEATIEPLEAFDDSSALERVAQIEQATEDCPPVFVSPKRWQNVRMSEGYGARSGDWPAAPGRIGGTIPWMSKAGIMR